MAWSPPSNKKFAGEYTTPAALASVYPTSSPGDSQGVLGPVGLGFRVPCLVVSPFSAGGWLCSDVFDHVSVLKLIEKVFLPSGTLMGPDGLDISRWRYKTVGDLSSALPTLRQPVDSVPHLAGDVNDRSRRGRANTDQCSPRDRRLRRGVSAPGPKRGYSHQRRAHDLLQANTELNRLVGPPRAAVPF